MKKYIYLSFFSILLGFSAVSNVKAYLNHAIFYAPGKGNYIETYITVSGNSVQYKKIAQKFSGIIRVEISFAQGDKIIAGNKYNLLTPEITDTLETPDFTDMQRYPLKAGTYQMEIKIADGNNTTEGALTSIQTIEVAEITDNISLSSIELVDSLQKTSVEGPFSKSGYNIIPSPLTYYPSTINKLIFYAEAYNALKQLGAESRFVFSYYIESADTKETFSGHLLKQNSAEVNPVIGQLDISQLSSGNYNLVVEVKTASNEIKIQKKLAFTKVAAPVALDKSTSDTVNFIAKVTNPDTLRDYIACLWPISSTSERDWQRNQIKNADVVLMQKYFYAFWQSRSPKNPEKAWMLYKHEVKQVKKKYACGNQPGYMSDRGRVYLQYGAPSSGQPVPYEPDSYPYEIWQYYRITNPVTGQYQTNRKFVFYNPTLDGKCFILLHSDARGETRDDRWQIKLKQRNNQIMDLDQTAPQSSYGDGANDLFNNPR